MYPGPFDHSETGWPAARISSVKDPGSVFNPKPDLDGHLKLADLSVNNCSANLGDLEPIQISNRPGRSFESVANSLVD